MSLVTRKCWHCDRCGHDWVKRGFNTPQQCPKCRQKKWNNIGEIKFGFIGNKEATIKSGKHKSGITFGINWEGTLAAIKSGELVPHKTQTPVVKTSPKSSELCFTCEEAPATTTGFCQPCWDKFLKRQERSRKAKERMDKPVATSQRYEIVHRGFSNYFIRRKGSDLEEPCSNDFDLEFQMKEHSAGPPMAPEIQIKLTKKQAYETRDALFQVTESEELKLQNPHDFFQITRINGRGPMMLVVQKIEGWKEALEVLTDRLNDKVHTDYHSSRPSTAYQYTLTQLIEKIEEVVKDSPVVALNQGENRADL